MASFNLIETGIKDLIIIEPTVFKDDRGYFLETYNKKSFKEIGLNMKFVQDNYSHSEQGVLRGLHIQKKHPQGKLVRVIKGEVYDVAVDVRKDSPTYGQWYGVFLSDQNKKMFYVPEGFLHGFLVISSEADFEYKCTQFYYPDDEDGVIWNDPDLRIKWPLEKVGGVILSQKDKSLKNLTCYKE